jgi:hypothetical protein
MRQQHPGIHDPPSSSSVITGITSGISYEKVDLHTTAEPEAEIVINSNLQYNSARNWVFSQNVAVSRGAIARFLVM